MARPLIAKEDKRALLVRRLVPSQAGLVSRPECHRGTAQRLFR